MKDIYQRLKDRWLDSTEQGLTLKTDLYDEAVSAYNIIPLFGNQNGHIIGTDVSFEVAVAAKQRMADEWNGWNNIAVSDARVQAFKSGVFDRIISNSTLDHFPEKRDLIKSLKELCRILKPGGVLIIALDNPWNPVVFLRNILPHRLLRLFGVIPFYMGVTLSRPELVSELELNGFKVSDSSAIVHSPRILAIWTGHIFNRLGSKKITAYFHRFLRAFELLEKFPAKFITGYYVAVKAVKR